MTRAKVSVLKTSPETVLPDIGKLMLLADFDKHLDPGAPTILKDNISWHFPYLSANTTPWQLEGVIRALRAHGHRALSSVHNDTVVTDCEKGQRLNRLSPIYRKYGIEERRNFLPDEIKWVTYTPTAKMRVLDRIFPEGIEIPEFFIAKNIVHLPTVKCHIYTTTTGAMKNAFGGLLSRRRHYTHSDIHRTLVDLLAIQKEIHAGLFAVMDGTFCGNGPGPRTMVPVEKNVMLASADQVAIDAIAAKMMGFDPMSIDYIRLATEAGLGMGDPAEIDVVGEDVSGWNFGFSVGDNVASSVGDLFWFSPLKVLQRLLFHTPIVNLFVFGSYFYHDKIWWPWKGVPLQAELRKTKWGRLFQSYDID